MAADRHSSRQIIEEYNIISVHRSQVRLVGADHRLIRPSPFCTRPLFRIIRVYILDNIIIIITCNIVYNILLFQSYVSSELHVCDISWV